MAGIRDIAESISSRLLMWNRESEIAQSSAADITTTPAEAVSGISQNVDPSWFTRELVVIGNGPLLHDIENHRTSGTALFIDVEYVQTQPTGCLDVSRPKAGSGSSLRAYHGIPEVQYGTLVDIYV